MDPIIEPVPCLKDNYAYVIHARGARDAVVVDPSEAGPVVAALAERGLALRGILATHHHADHVGGIAGLLAAAATAGTDPGGAGGQPIWVAGHAEDRGRIPGQTIFVEAPLGHFAPAGLTVAGRPLLAAHIPGHTRAAIAWGIPASGAGLVPGDVFTGDTLFGAGCGRLFEGTPAEMLASLRTLTALPPATRLWFGHEYTANNLRFAATAEPDSAAVRARQSILGACTTPTTVALERDTNPFVRAASVEELAARRAAKDRF